MRIFLFVLLNEWQESASSGEETIKCFDALQLQQPPRLQRQRLSLLQPSLLQTEPTPTEPASTESTPTEPASTEPTPTEPAPVECPMGTGQEYLSCECTKTCEDIRLGRACSTLTVVPGESDWKWTIRTLSAEDNNSFLGFVCFWWGMTSPPKSSQKIFSGGIATEPGKVFWNIGTTKKEKRKKKKKRKEK